MVDTDIGCLGGLFIDCSLVEIIGDLAHSGRAMHLRCIGGGSIAHSLHFRFECERGYIAKAKASRLRLHVFGVLERILILVEPKNTKGESMNTAFLHPAFVWDCDECGQENFVRAVRIEKTKKELEEMKEAFGIRNDDEGEFLGMPTEVECQRCGKEYVCDDD